MKMKIILIIVFKNVCNPMCAIMYLMGIHFFWKNIQFENEVHKKHFEYIMHYEYIYYALYTGFKYTVRLDIETN